MWVEFAVGSRPCFEGFSSGSLSKINVSNSIGNLREMGLSVEDCYVLPSLLKFPTGALLQFTALVI